MVEYGQRITILENEREGGRSLDEESIHGRVEEFVDAIEAPARVILGAIDSLTGSITHFPLSTDCKLETVSEVKLDLVTPDRDLAAFLADKTPKRQVCRDAMHARSIPFSRAYPVGVLAADRAWRLEGLPPRPER